MRRNNDPNYLMIKAPFWRGGRDSKTTYRRLRKKHLVRKFEQVFGGEGHKKDTPIRQWRAHFPKFLTSESLKVRRLGSLGDYLQNPPIPSIRLAIHNHRAHPASAIIPHLPSKTIQPKKKISQRSSVPAGSKNFVSRIQGLVCGE